MDSILGRYIGYITMGIINYQAFMKLIQQNVITQTSIFSYRNEMYCARRYFQFGMLIA